MGEEKGYVRKSQVIKKEEPTTTGWKGKERGGKEGLKLYVVPSGTGQRA